MHPKGQNGSAANGRSQAEGQRVLCPRCQANNFLGQRQCWQCHGSLPPPDTFTGSTATRQAPAQMQHPALQPPSIQSAPQPFMSERAAPRNLLPLLIVAALLTFVVVLVVALQFRPQMPQSRAVSYTPGAENPVGTQPGPSAGSSLSESPDARAKAAVAINPVEDAARRAVEREAPKIGLPPPAAVSPDGRIQLRSGGSISAQQWEETRRKLQNSPLVKEPPPPGPF